MALVRAPSDRPVIAVGDAKTLEGEVDGDFAGEVALARPEIKSAIAATGRIELTEHPRITWAGSAFLAGPGLLITARTAADRFVDQIGSRTVRHGPVFRTGTRLGEGASHRIVACLNRHPVLDVAVLQLEGVPDVESLQLDCSTSPSEGDSVAVVSFFSLDPRNDRSWMEELSNLVEAQKVFAPGVILGRSTDLFHTRGSWSVLHDCSTLGGAAGAPLLHLGTGRVIGSHFAGRSKLENYAVPASELALDPRIRALDLNFADGAPDPDPLAFESEYADASTSPSHEPARLPDAGLRRVDRELVSQFPDLDSALGFLRRHGLEFARAIDAQPGRGVVSDDEYRMAVLDSLNRRGLLDAEVVASLIPSEDEPPELAGNASIRSRTIRAEPPSLSRAALSSVLASLPNLRQSQVNALYVVGSPHVDEFLEPGGAGTLAEIVNRLAERATPASSKALGWLLREIGERDGNVDREPIKNALIELGQEPNPTDSDGAHITHEADPLEMVDISFLSSGLEATRSVGVVRFADTGSTCWLLAPDLVVAPAHLSSVRGGLSVDKLLSREEVVLNRVSVEFDGNGPTETKRAVDVVEVASIDHSTDLMILRLADPFTDRRPLQIDLTRQHSVPISAIHHPNLGDSTLSYVDGRVLSNDGHEVRYTLATAGGSAGAPILNQAWKVVATHRRWIFDDQGRRVKSGTSVEALVESLRGGASEEGLWRHICGAQDALRSIDPRLVSLDHNDRQSALLTLVDPMTTLPEIEGLSVISRDFRLLNVLVDGGAARQLAATQGVVSMQASDTANQVECRVSLPFIGVPLDRTGIDDTGDGAIVAIIDDGIDPFHHAFQDANGNSRIDLYWDQRATTTPLTEPATTISQEAADLVARLDILGGAVHLGSDLDRLGHGQRGALRDGVAHGTATASIAAGRSSGPSEQHFGGGLAPDATLIVVRFDAAGQSIGASVGHIRALTVIGARARELDLPVVVNISNGMNSGAHDGTSVVERECARFVESPNRSVVKSAGNELGYGRHARFDLVDANAKVLRWISEPVPGSQRTGGVDELELWFGTHHQYEFTIVDADRGQSTPIIPVRHAFYEHLPNMNDVRATYEHISEANARKSRLAIRIEPGAKKSVQAGEWKLLIKARTFSDSDTFHAWIEDQPERRIQFKNETTTDCTITIPGTGTETITVGAIETGDEALLYEHGSRGPNADDVVKPDLVAPGVDIRAARADTERDAMVEGLSGTSLAAPHVAGAIALALSIANKAGAQLTQGEIRMLVINSSDNFNVRGSPERGYGRLNVGAFLAAVRERIAQ